MIKLIQNGKYNLKETDKYDKILTMCNGEEHIYKWIKSYGNGEIRETANMLSGVEIVLTDGKFRLYEIKNERGLTDGQHLELLVGEGIWQGYLLSTGFPKSKKTSKKITPTKELVTKSFLTHFPRVPFPVQVNY